MAAPVSLPRKPRSPRAIPHPDTLQFVTSIDYRFTPRSPNSRGRDWGPGGSRRCCGSGCDAPMTEPLEMCQRRGGSPLRCSGRCSAERVLTPAGMQPSSVMQTATDPALAGVGDC
jgi:hypothetical protein